MFKQLPKPTRVQSTLLSFAIVAGSELDGTFWNSARDGVRLFSHSLIKVLAVRCRFPGASFVKVGQGISFRSSGAGVSFRGRGVASVELLFVRILAPMDEGA